MERVRTVQHERLTIQEAAHRLGVSESAVRKRIKRGTLKREKTEDGRVLVYVGVSAPGAEEVRTPEGDALISEMRSRIQFLEDELQRKDAILLNMTEAMKALSPPSHETPPEERESPETVEEEPEGAESRPATAGPQEPAWRRWRRRWFGG